jgi:predicted anti-sigma-YlaC factor YlaD
MFCDEVLELVEAIAAGDLTPDARVMTHVQSCPGCAAALSAARRVDGLLKQRTVPNAPPQLTTRIMGRIRRDRWRRDQFLDLGFNLAVGVVLLFVLAGFWVVLSQSGLGGISYDAANVLGSAASDVIHRAAPSLPLYLAAAAIVATALGVWWWAEKDA